MQHFQTFVYSFAGCHRRNSPTTSSNDSNCSSITIIIIINQTTTRTTCTASSEASLQHAPSRQIHWDCKWDPTIRPCKARSSSPRTALTWTCTSPLEAHATCSKELTAGTSTSSTDLTPAMTPSCSRIANARRSWISSRTSARFRPNNSSRIRNRLYRHPSKAPPVQTASRTAHSIRLHQTTPTRRNSRTTSYWTASIRSTTTRARPISTISWLPIKKLFNCLSRCGPSTGLEMTKLILRFTSWLRRETFRLFMNRSLWMFSRLMFRDADRHSHTHRHLHSHIYVTARKTLERRKPS